MIFERPTLAEETVRANFLEYMASENLEWRKRMEARHAYYEGDKKLWLEDFRNLLKLLYPNTAHEQESILTWINLVRFAVDLKAQVYRKGAKRTLVDKHGEPVSDQEALEAFALWEEETAQDEVWDEANRLAVLLGTVLVWIQTDAETGELVYQVVPNYRVWVHCDDKRPWELESAKGIAIELEPARDSITTGIEATQRFARYTKNSNIVELTLTWRDGTPLPEPQPTYGLRFYPFVKVDKRRSQGFFVHGDDDLVEYPKAVVRQLTDLANTLHYAGFPMLVAAGFTEEEVRSLVVGANRIIHSTSPDARLEALAPKTPFVDLLKVIVDGIKLWGITQHIPPMEFDIKETYQSGISRVQARQPLLEERERQIKQFRRLERIAFRKAMQIRKAFVHKEVLLANGVNSEIARLRSFDLSQFEIEVEFPPVQPVYDRLTELQILEKERELGLR